MSANSSQGDGQSILDNFRHVKHDINNALAVMMALAELAERSGDPEGKLVQAVKSRCPEIARNLQELQKLLQTNR